MPILTRRGFLAAGAATVLAARPALADAAPFHLGHICPSSGPLKGTAEPSIAAVDLAVAEINGKGGVGGHPIVISRYDSGSDPRQAAVAARKLITDDGVLAIIGPFSSGETQVAVNDAERAHVVMIPAAASVPGLTDGKTYLFRLNQDEGTQFDRMMQTVKRIAPDAKSAGIVYISDEAVDADAGTRVYPRALDKYGIAHGPAVSITYKTFDVSPQIARLLGEKPDLVALAALPDPANKVVRELRRQGFTGHVIGSQLYADPVTATLFGRDGDGVMLMTGFWHKSSPEAEAFDSKFIAANAAVGIKKAGAFHTDAQSYDIVNVLATAMMRAGVTGAPDKLDAEREAIRAGMVGLTYSGVLGKDICFAGQEAHLPGYAIGIMNDEWNLLQAFAPSACGPTG